MKTEKEILEAIRVLQEANPHDEGIQNWVRYYFPELKESEDERIRKRLIAMCKHYIECYALDPYNIDDYKEALAWLEKQGEQKPVIEMKTPEESLGIDSDTYNKIVDECVYGEQKPEGKTAQEAIKEEKVDNANKIEPNDYSSVDPHFFKPTDKAEPKFKVGDLVKYTNHNKQPIYKVNYIDKECYICTSDDATLGDKAVMHFAFDNPYLRLVEQKPADVEEISFFEDFRKTDSEVEPKFKIGDWITDGYVGGQITSIEDNYPCYKIADFIGGINTSIPFSLQDNYHLWTIQDAKYGDMLADDYGIYIFEKFDECDKNCYVCIGAYQYSQKVYEYEHMLCSTDTHPATKEQREFLFQKMKEVGYEWDAEKKELEKIIDEKQIKKNLQDNGFRRMFEQKPAWSEEDERTYKSVLYAFEHNYPLNSEQQKFIKSLRQQNRWKPSDEQMEALEHFVRSIGESGYASSYDNNTKLLYSLLSDLKKLKGE